MRVMVVSTTFVPLPELLNNCVKQHFEGICGEKCDVRRSLIQEPDTFVRKDS
jgi:hypothetical protein